MFKTSRGPISLKYVFILTMKLFNMFISSVQAGILSLNVCNIERTYFTSSLFSFWQCEIIQYVHFNCKNWYFKFKCLKHKRGPISLLAYFHFDIIMWYYHFKCKNWYFRFKWLKHREDLFHFWHVLILAM